MTEVLVFYNLTTLILTLKRFFFNLILWRPICIDQVWFLTPIKAYRRWIIKFSQAVYQNIKYELIQLYLSVKDIWMNVILNRLFLLLCFFQLFHEDGECWVYDEPLLKRLTSQRHWVDTGLLLNTNPCIKNCAQTRVFIRTLW